MRTFMYRSSAYLVAAAAVIGGTYKPVSTLQISNAPVVDHVVAISVLQNVRPNAYAPTTLNVPVIYVGEAVGFELVLTNATDQEIAIGGDAASWVDNVRLIVEKAQTTRVEDASVRIVARTRNSLPGRVNLAPGRSTNAQLTLQSESGEPVPPGMYTIAVELPTIASLGTGRNITKRRLNFEVREPVAREDILDHYLHEAYRARIEKRLEAQRSWLNRVLAMHPNSMVAWLDLADVSYRQGDCQAAVPALKRGLSLLMSKADPELRVRPPASHGEVLQQQLRKCGAQ